MLQPSTSNGRASAKPCKYVATTTHNEAIKSIPVHAWNDDVEVQATSLTTHLREVLEKAQQPIKEGPKKPYIDDVTWKIRAEKIAVRKRLQTTKWHLQRQALLRCFYAWRNDHLIVNEATFDSSSRYITTLICHRVHIFAAYKVVCRQLRKVLVTAKGRALKCTMDAIGEDTPASAVLTQLRAFVGPSNPKKFKHKPLPMIRTAEDQICVTPQDITDAWVTFFQTMECGQRMSRDDLRALWIQELRAFRHDKFQIALVDLPSLTDLEMALRRVPRGRSCGPDGLPGEVCHHHAAAVARHLYPQLLKMLLHGQEHLGFKGGRLTPAYKGRGPTDRCTSYRSLLVSNHLGKALHRTIREHHSQLFHRFLQLQQTGGRKHVPVQLAQHQLRTFVRAARRDCQSTGILYLDLTEAFYRVLREMPMGGEIPDHVIAHVASRMKLPADSLHRLYDMLAQPCALTQAGMSDIDRRAIQAIHTSTHFWVQGQQDVSRTAMGTRPGDSMADWIFAFAWSTVLDKVESFMRERHMLQVLPAHECLPMFGRAATIDATFPFIGPNWMDDLALCVQSTSSAQLVSDMGAVAGFLLDTCKEHCLTPNLAAGKTEVQLSFRGKHSRQYKKDFYGPNAAPTLTVLGEDEQHHIRIVRSYRHLGGIAHHTGEQATELTQKAAIGHQALNQHRKILFQNKQLPLSKRTELFTMLVLSKCLYGAESWVLSNKKMEKRFSTLIMNLYKRLACVRIDTHHTDEDILVMVQLPSPCELLRRARLRYFTTLVHSGLPDLWALLARDTDWIQLLENDMVWMWRQLQFSSSLPDPREHYEQWLYLIQTSPGYWKRLIRRACLHGVLQRQRLHQVCELHRRVLPRLWSLVQREGRHAQIADTPEAAGFGCMLCKKTCKNAAGEAAHMCKTHGVVSKLRFLYDHPTCGACLKHFHTMEKLKAHLYYNRACRSMLQSRAHRCTPTPGTGSQCDRQRVTEHDRMLPPLQGQGPAECPVRARQELDVDGDWHQFLVDSLCDADTVSMFRAGIYVRLETHAISWTLLRRTLHFFKETLAEEDTVLLGFDFNEVKNVIETLSRSEHWDFLQESQSRDHRPTLEALEQECREITEHIEEQQPESVPRVFGKHRVMLHAFSGRRRAGDVQFYLDQLAKQQSEYILHIVSMDIIVDKVKGNAMNFDTWDFWINPVRQRHVIAFLAGPPCETWSCARGVTTQKGEDRSQPRVIRVLEHMWGIPSARIKELMQLFTGNTLLGFALVIFLEICLIDGYAILEHPAEPLSDPQAASIWKLPLVGAILAFPNVQKIRFSQGLLGAFAPKPTNLMTANLPHLILDLHACRVRTEIPHTAAIGKNSDGSWKTTTLKEYPPALCRSMAISLARALSQTKVDPSAPEPSEALLHQFTAMDVKTYGSVIGADFAGG